MAVNGHISKMVVVVAVVVVDDISGDVEEHVAVRLDARCVAVQVQSFHAPFRVVTEVVLYLLPITTERSVEEIYTAWISARLAILAGSTGVVARGLVRALAVVFYVVESDDVQRGRSLIGIWESRMDSCLRVDSVVVNVVHKIVTDIRAYDLVDEHPVSGDVRIGVSRTRFAWFRLARVFARWPWVTKPSAIVDLCVGYRVVATCESRWVACFVEVHTVPV